MQIEVAKTKSGTQSQVMGFYYHIVRQFHRHKMIHRLGQQLAGSALLAFAFWISYQYVLFFPFLLNAVDQFNLVYKQDWFNIMPAVFGATGLWLFISLAVKGMLLILKK